MLAMELLEKYNGRKHLYQNSLATNASLAIITADSFNLLNFVSKYLNSIMNKQAF